MSIRIQLNSSQPLYTNLDFIGGKAILSLTKNETIEAITVKLEGESKTRLVGDPPIKRRRDDSVEEIEVHKVLYKATTVFPPENLQNTSRGSIFTLHPGQHEFPFEFKLPFNNIRADRQSTFVNIAGLQVQAPRNTDRHVRQTLPPTLHYFQDQAIIRYYVKATVARPQFYKENFRTEYAFSFFPIEPPRPAPNRNESYARIQHHFAPVSDLTSTANSPAKSPGFFRRKSVPTAGSDSPVSPTITPLQVCIDARLPDPAIITCNETIPLRILITKINDSSATVFLQLMQIELVANTIVRAHHLKRGNLTSTVLISKSNMRMRLPEKDKVMEIDKRMWNDIPLPNTVAPTFETCNISRVYEVHIKVGLTHGSGEQIYPELTVQTLKMPVSVYSGIAPPADLLRAIAGTPAGSSHNTSTNPSSKTSAHRPPRPPGAVHPEILPQHSTTPTQTGQTDPLGPEGPFEDEAPPTYQEAIAEGIGPVEGTRREYQHREG
ncbi:MAG: hypothetical protein Q9166_003134 [cf. Caloplaca sp. 2 TL-2023]